MIVDLYPCLILSIVLQCSCCAVYVSIAENFLFVGASFDLKYQNSSEEIFSVLIFALYSEHVLYKVVSFNFGLFKISKFCN